MPKMTGLANALWIDGIDLSGDTQHLDNANGGPALMPFTTIDKSAQVRQGGQRDGALTATTFFNVDSGRSQPTLKTLPRTDRLITYCTGQAIGSQVFNIIGKQIGYDGTRADDGTYLFSVNALANGYGAEWCDLLTAGQRADTAATNGTGLDLLASSAFGLQAYLHVFAFTGTSVTVKLQHSTDNAVGDPYVDITGGGFTAATAITSQRIATTNALTIRRWVRVVTTGTFSAATFSVSVAKNLTAVSF